MAQEKAWILAGLLYFESCEPEYKTTSSPACSAILDKIPGHNKTRRIHSIPAPLELALDANDLPAR
jgi:hypothetical protein